MNCKIVEKYGKPKTFLKYGNESGFLSLEVFEGKVVIDSHNAPDLDFSPAKARSLATWLNTFADTAEAYVPPKEPKKSIKHVSIKDKEKFVAIDRKTGAKGLNGGVCTCTDIKPNFARPLVLAVDACDQEREFPVHKWTFLKRN